MSKLGVYLIGRENHTGKYTVIRCKGVRPTDDEYDYLPTDLYEIRTVYGYTRDDALVAFGLQKGRE
jgi:hypothetical protein